MPVPWRLQPDQSSLSIEVAAYVEAGIAPATKRAYRADLDHFKDGWHGWPDRPIVSRPESWWVE